MNIRDEDLADSKIITVEIWMGGLIFQMKFKLIQRTQETLDPPPSSSGPNLHPQKGVISP